MKQANSSLLMCNGLFSVRSEGDLLAFLRMLAILCIIALNQHVLPRLGIPHVLSLFNENEISFTKMSSNLEVANNSKTIIKRYSQITGTEISCILWLPISGLKIISAAIQTHTPQQRFSTFFPLRNPQNISHVSRNPCAKK